MVQCENALVSYCKMSMNEYPNSYCLLWIIKVSPEIEKTRNTGLSSTLQLCPFCVLQTGYLKLHLALLQLYNLNKLPLYFA